MKYCAKCGAELFDEAVVCVKCGAPTQEYNANTTTPQAKSSTFITLAKVFMIIGTVTMGLLCLPLAWCIPMTITYHNKIKQNQPISTAFKICTLIFVSMLAGIFMLIDENQ